MKLVIVTGGSRGLGAALCEMYAGAGRQVVEFSRTAPHPFSVHVDLSDPGRAVEVFEKTIVPLGDLSLSEVVAVSNAAMLGPVGPVERSSPLDIVAHIHVGVTSAVLFARTVVAAFQDHACPKTLVNISSGAATTGLAGWSLYCACKAAMENYIRAVALEQALRPHPIRAISISPGVMDTAMQDSVRSADVGDFPTVERFIRLHREGRLASPAAVAERIAGLVEARLEPGRVYSVAI